MSKTKFHPQKPLTRSIGLNELVTVDFSSGNSIFSETSARFKEEKARLAFFQKTHILRVMIFLILKIGLGMYFNSILSTLQKV